MTTTFTPDARVRPRRSGLASRPPRRGGHRGCRAGVALRRRGGVALQPHRRARPRRVRSRIADAGPVGAVPAGAAGGARRLRDPGRRGGRAQRPARPRRARRRPGRPGRDARPGRRPRPRADAARRGGHRGPRRVRPAQRRVHASTRSRSSCRAAWWSTGPSSSSTGSTTTASPPSPAWWCGSARTPRSSVARVPGRRRRAALTRARDRARRRARPPGSRYLNVQQRGTAHLADRHARCRRSGQDANLVGGPGRARRRLRPHPDRLPPRRPGRHRRPARRLLRRGRPDARLPHLPGPRRARHHVATCCSRARSAATAARSTPGSSGCGTKARGTNAFQTNRNIKLSATHAWAESVPNLEIENNDVHCSHASTVGPIDEDQRFYLESRGVPPQVAERLVVAGFFDEVLDQLPVPERPRGLRRDRIAAGPPGRRRSRRSRCRRDRGADLLASTTSRQARPARSTSATIASPSCASATTSTPSATSAPTRRSRCPRARSTPTTREIECWKHGSCFSLETGEPNSLPATKAVPVYDVADRRATTCWWCSRERPSDLTPRARIEGLRAGSAGKEILHGHRPASCAAARCTPSWARTARASPPCRT